MKKYLKKTLSVFLSFLMVLSCFVFAPEMFTIKADAAKAGTYKWKVTLYVEEDYDWKHDAMDVKVDYYTNNGYGSDMQNDGTSYFHVNKNQYENDKANYSFEGTSKGFPVRVRLSEMKNKNSIWNANYHCLLYVKKGNDWVTLADSGKVTGIKKGKFLKNLDVSNRSASNENWPKPASFDADTTSFKLTVPGGVVAGDTSKVVKSSVKDQYGVSWYNNAEYSFRETKAADAAKFTKDGLLVTNTKTTTAQDNSTFNVTDTTALKDYIAAGENGITREVYAYPTANGVTFDKPVTITLENPQYTVKFDPNGGTFPQGTTTEVTRYYKKTIGDILPQVGIRDGYIFKGIYTAKTGGSQITADTLVTASTTYYAQWEPIDNMIAFYNYDGQPIDVITSKYGTRIGTLVPANPTRPSSSSGDYAFKRWVNWETGEEINLNATLNSLNSDYVLKFIAEYELGTPKTYTYKFFENGSQVSNGGGVYRSDVNFPSNPSKADEARDNGYSFKFAGWIVESDNGAAPADVIVAPNEKLEDKVKGKTFLSVDDGAFAYYLKENIKLYPVYVASYKQCTVTLHYKDANGNWQVSTTKNADTACLKYYNLGIPNPKAHNHNYGSGLKSYVFTGWTSASNPTPGVSTPDSDKALGNNLAINVQLHNNIELWATYEAQELKFHAYYYNNGELLLEKEQQLNVPFEVTTGSTPTKERNGQIGYTFKGWYLNEDGTGEPQTTYTITESNLANPTFYAVYDSFNYYEVTFLDDEGNVIMIPGENEGDPAKPATSKDYKAGDVLTPPTVKDKEASAKYAYAFTGWKDSHGNFHAKDEVLTVSGNETYTAVFERQIRKYTLKFYDVKGQTFDEDGNETSTPVKTVELEYGTNIHNWIEANNIKNLVLGSIPETTKQYRHEFSGWSPNLNSETTVTGDEVYKATYRTTAVTYNVHWLVPETAEQNTFKETVSKYLYERIISIPSTKPTCAEPTVWDEVTYPKDAYTWGFLGWYSCDANGIIKTDAEGNEIKFERGTPATADDTYYVAKFGYASKAFTVRIYDEDKTTLLDEFYGNAYGGEVPIPLSYVKNPEADGHYVISGFNKVSDGSAAADVIDGSAVYIVGTDNDLYVTFVKEAHSFGPWFTVTEQNYETKGEEERFCHDCDYRQTQVTPILVDDQAPTGIAYIGGYTWPGATTGIAYVRSDSLVSIVARDLGQKDFHKDQTAGSGIKTIKYAWVDGETVGDFSTESFDKYQIDANINFQLPADFAGKKLRVVITDYTDKEYTFDTAVLNVDLNKPVVETVSDCQQLFFGIKEDFELKSVKIEKLGADGKYEVVPASEYTKADITDSDYKDGYQLIAPKGTYKITATDMAGNVSTPVVVTVSGEHSFGEYVTIKEPTCTEVGLKHKVCSVCGETTADEEIKAAGHKWAETETIDLEPTCTEAGSKSIHCTVCDEKKADSITAIDALGHDEKITEVFPTCTKGGYKLTTCKRCDGLWVLVTEGYDAKGHTADEAKHAHKDATCTEAGYDYDICKDCGEKFNETTIDKLPHSFTKNVTPDGACTGKDENGHFYGVWECDVCGETMTNYPELAAHDYSVKSEKPVTPATCGKNAVYKYTCSRCDAFIEKEERFTALEHEYETIIDKKPTCTETGLKHDECKNCGDKKADVVIDALGHDLVVDAAKSTPATCAADGKEYLKCSRCDYFEENTIPATGKHEYTVELTEKYVAPTCETAGSKTFKCTGCDKTNVVEIAALGHAHADGAVGKVIKAATCKAEGTIEYTCIHTVDGKEHTYTETIPVDRNAHDAKDGLLVSVVKAATCTEGGEEIRNCKTCGSAVIVKTDKLGHDYTGVKVLKEATCVEDGSKIACCSRCGEVDPNATEEVIKATGSHTLTKHDAVNATCTKDGAKEYYECSVCGKFFADAEGKTEIAADKLAETIKITAKGHSYGDYIVVEPTCSADGYKYKVCSVCSEKTENEPTGKTKLNHVGGVHTLVKINKSATCKAEGEGVYKCSLCGDLFTKAIPVDPEAHTAVWSTIAATCTAAGSRTKKCDLCGKVLDTAEIPALGHAYKITTSTELQDGKIVTITTHTCTRKGCGYSYSDPAQVIGDACKITFVVNGVASEITLEKGSKLRKSDLPAIDLTSTDPAKKKEVKWMIGSTEATFPMVVSSDITITAVITEVDVQFTVKFVNTLTRETISETVYGYNADVKAPEDLIVSGFTFDGWSTVPGDPEVPVYAGDVIPNATADVTYYSVFTAKEGVKTYYVTFRNHTGTKILSTSIVEQGAAAEAPATVPTRSTNSVFHYVFAGWVDKDGNAVTFPIANVSKNITVYAKFSEVKHSDHATPVAGSIKAATCTTPAEVTYKCDGCGYEWIQYTAEALGHDYVEHDRTDADGKLTITYKCTRCGSTWTKTVVYNPNANIIVVNVSDASGNPVEGASVQLYLGDLKTITAVTDAKGQAKFPKYDAEKNPNGLKDGEYTVKVTKSGYNDASGKMTIKDGTGFVNLTFVKIDCHCICHSSGLFGKIRRFFNKLIRSMFNKNYTCCSCGECEKIYK